jgi:hypothetical protein
MSYTLRQIFGVTEIQISRSKTIARVLPLEVATKEGMKTGSRHWPIIIINNNNNIKDTRALSTLSSGIQPTVGAQIRPPRHHVRRGRTARRSTWIAALLLGHSTVAAEYAQPVEFFMYRRRHSGRDGTMRR